MLELLAMGTDHAAAEKVAAELGGVVYRNHPTESDKRPYSTLLRVASDKIDEVTSVADVGLHIVFAREIKAQTGTPSAERVVASFPLVRHPDLSHRQADDHWRDVHGPLALEHHAAMCDYWQLSVVATISGQPIDGVALCAFDTRDDMRTRFFNDDDSRAAIEADVSTFADPRNSPRRVVLVQTR